jgi:hypothetical protein
VLILETRCRADIVVVLVLYGRVVFGSLFLPLPRMSTVESLRAGCNVEKWNKYVGNPDFSGVSKTLENVSQNRTFAEHLPT